MLEKIEQIFYSTAAYVEAWVREELLTLDSGLQLAVSVGCFSLFYVFINAVFLILSSS